MNTLSQREEEASEGPRIQEGIVALRGHLENRKERK
jgi:hypothetical protein